jgi:hypothetical protein
MIDAHPNAPRWWQQADMVRHFAVFLIIDGPKKIFELWRATAANFEAELSIVSTAKNLMRPLFQDYSREGRIIGFFLRLVRIVAGIIVQLALVAVFIALSIGWILLPLYLAYQIFSNLFIIVGRG